MYLNCISIVFDCISIAFQLYLQLLSCRTRLQLFTCFHARCSMAMCTPSDNHPHLFSSMINYHPQKSSSIINYHPFSSTIISQMSSTSAYRYESSVQKERYLGSTCCTSVEIFSETRTFKRIMLAIMLMLKIFMMIDDSKRIFVDEGDVEM